MIQGGDFDKGNVGRHFTDSISIEFFFSTDSISLFRLILYIYIF